MTGAFERAYRVFLVLISRVLQVSIAFAKGSNVMLHLAYANPVAVDNPQLHSLVE